MAHAVDRKQYKLHREVLLLQDAPPKDLALDGHAEEVAAAVTWR